MSEIDTKAGKAVLTLAHVVGMVDLVALPLWIGTMMQHHRFSAPEAGITVTAFLAAVVASSALLAPRFNRLAHRFVVAGGFSIAAVAFFAVAMQPIDPASWLPMLALHALAGLGVGSALSITHGCIGRSRNPHRLFATVSILLGVFAVLFLSSVPQLIARTGPTTLFAVFAATMALAAIVTLTAFPKPPKAPTAATARNRATKFTPTTWLVIATVACLTLNQAMVFSFVERIGAARGFPEDQVNSVLIALGFVNLLPGTLAALFQSRFSPVLVGIAGPLGQAVLALTLSQSLAFAPYALAGALYASMVIFTHTFLFGLLTRLDATGRAVAGTPAMMMLGSCIGPALGGAVVHAFGYSGLGWAACMVATVAVLLMLRVRSQLGTRSCASPSLAEVAL